MIVSGRQQRDSALYIQISILPQTPLPSRLPYGAEAHVLHSESLLVAHFKYSSVYLTTPNSLTIPSTQQVWLLLDAKERGTFISD